MADTIIISLLLICGILALRACLRRPGKGNCGGCTCSGHCNSCAQGEEHKKRTTAHAPQAKPEDLTQHKNTSS